MPGDCDGNGSVTVDEIVRGVTFALGIASLNMCEAADANGDGSVSIDELIAAVNAAANGCS